MTNEIINIISNIKHIQSLIEKDNEILKAKNKERYSQIRAFANELRNIVIYTIDENDCKIIKHAASYDSAKNSWYCTMYNRVWIDEPIFFDKEDARNHLRNKLLEQLVKIETE